jgi:hypothetical protein
MVEASSYGVRGSSFWWRALLVCSGVGYIGLPLSELGPRTIHPLVSVATLSYLMTFVLASRELGVIKGQRQAGYDSSAPRWHRMVPWSIIVIGAVAILVGLGILILVALALGRSNVPTG